MNSSETVSLSLSLIVSFSSVLLSITLAFPWASWPHKPGVIDVSILDIHPHILRDCTEDGLFPDNSSENSSREGSDWFSLGHVGLGREADRFLGQGH